MYSKSVTMATAAVLAVVVGTITKEIQQSRIFKNPLPQPVIVLNNDALDSENG